MFQSVFQYSLFSAEFLVLHKSQLIVSCLNVRDLHWDQLLHSPEQPWPYTVSAENETVRQQEKADECKCRNLLSNWIHTRKPQNKSGLAILKTKHKIHASNLVSSWSAIQAKQIHTFREIIYTLNYSYWMEGRKGFYFYFYFRRGEIITHAPSVHDNSLQFGGEKYKRP